MEILIEPKYMVHEGGTKFYEVVQFYHVALHRYVLAFRWGKLSDFQGGGATKIEIHTDARKCQDAARKKIKDKSHRGYREVVEVFGLHGINKVDADLLPLKLGAHYDDKGVIEGVMSRLGLDSIYAQVVETIDTDGDISDDIMEPVRSNDWGSW